MYLLSDESTSICSVPLDVVAVVVVVLTVGVVGD